MQRHPRSISQLLLLGFFAVITPLAIVIAFVVHSLEEQSIKNQQMTRTVVRLTRASQELQADLLDIERRARQYATLGEANLLLLFQREQLQVLNKLEQIQQLMDVPVSTDTTIQLRLQLEELDERITAAAYNSNETSLALEMFDQIGLLNRDLQQATRRYVDVQQADNIQQAMHIRSILLRLVAFVVALTLVFMLLFIYGIIKPIREIETEIRRLGAGDLSRQIGISGPTEMQQLGQQLEWLRTRLHEIDQQKQQFLRHMSHELKTPLASLREGTDLMVDGVVGNLTEPQREIVSIVQENSLELQRLIENLLDYSSLPGQTLQLESIKLKTLWQELIGAYSISIERKQLEVVASGEVEEWRADLHKLKTALDNLLSNAVNYTPAKGRIEIHWRVEHEALLIEVANTGTRIPASEARDIFKPFFQGSSSRMGPIKGSGIGLSVARESILAHGGALELVGHQHLPVCFQLSCPLMGAQR